MAKIIVVIFLSFVSIANAQTVQYFNQTGVFDGRSVQVGNVIRYYDKTGKYIGEEIKTDNGTRDYDATGKLIGTSK